MWDTIKNFFSNIHGSINGFLIDKLQLDNLFIGLYEQYIQPIPEVFKILGAVFLIIVIILGTISFVKKMFKLFLVIAIILVIVMFASQYV
jgi:hypothetical protein